jgi:alpha-mannosidase
VQDVILRAEGKRVEFATQVEYHERHRMLRAEFVPTVFSDRVQCDIQFGSLFRSTKDQTAVEKAQFEICAHKYIDVSDAGHGLSLLNDCKYGHRVKEGRISLNLLRSTVFPDPLADRGHHVFTYALYPHDGIAGVGTLQESTFLNQPFIASDHLIAIQSIATSTNPAIVIETIKKAYEGDAIILRLYESQGCNQTTSIHLGFSPLAVVETDLDEQNEKAGSLENLSFTPYEIKTLRCQVGRSL